MPFQGFKFLGDLFTPGCNPGLFIYCRFAAVNLKECDIFTSPPCNKAD